MNKLLELADRCEKATGPDRTLDGLIMAAFYIREERFIGIMDGNTDDPVVSTVWVDPKTNRWVSTGPHPFTSSLDAALTLVPGGWTRAVDATAPELGIDVDLSPRYFGTSKMVHATHLSEPIATCIAAIRARAALSETPS